MLTRRSFSTQTVITGAASALGLAHAPFALSQAATARIMIGFPPGTAFDSLARRVAERLRGMVAPAVIVENKPGAGGQIALTTIKDSAGDGSNILISPSSLFTISPHTNKKLPYKIEDLKPIATSVILEPAIAVGPAVPEKVKTLKDFLAWTKENPTGGTYATPAAGSMLHLIGVYVSKVSNLNWQHVAYRGAAPAIQDLIGGQVSAAILPVSEFIPHLKGGKVRVLAISSKERSSFLPEVPTLRQNGIPINAREWYGFYLPASASPEVVRRTAAYLQVVLTNPDMVNWANSVSLQMQFRGPDEAQALLKAELEEWRQLIKVIGFTAES